MIFKKNSLAAANRLFKLSVITDAITMMGLIRGIKPFIHKCYAKIGQREEAERRHEYKCGRCRRLRTKGNKKEKKKI